MLVMKREHRLRASAEFKEVYGTGRVYSSSLTAMYVAGGGEGKRIGIVVCKRVGGAVKRNRVRRLFREACRLFLPYMKNGSRVVFVAKAQARNAGFHEVCSSVRNLLERAALLGGCEDERHGGE